MRQIQADLWETKMENPAKGLYTHAYLQIRDDGNVLFYNTGNRQQVEEMADLGGVSRQYLSHEDELGDTLNLIAERYGARLGGHVIEETAFARFRKPDILFRDRETHAGNIEVIPTPGHTPGSVCFLVASPLGKTYLFTGDTIFLDGNEQWTAGFLPSFSDREALIESLTLIRELKPDVVLSSACGGKSGYEILPSPEAWAERVDHALSALSHS